MSLDLLRGEFWNLLAKWRWLGKNNVFHTLSLRFAPITQALFIFMAGDITFLAALCRIRGMGDGLELSRQASGAEELTLLEIVLVAESVFKKNRNGAS